MFVIIYEPSSDEVLLCRELAEDEVMDCRSFADELASQYGLYIDDSDGYIPNCSGDIRVEFREDPDNSARIWDGESFYFKHGE